MSRRMENKIEDILTEDQFGFRKNIGISEAILELRTVIEKELGRISLHI